jgi:hypothetical protein
MSSEFQKFDATFDRITRPRNKHVLNQVIYSPTPNFYGSNASGGIARDSSDGDSDPNGDTGTADDEFAIKINGTAPTQGSDGIVIPASSFTISVNSGSFTLDAPIVRPSSNPLSQSISMNQNETGDFPVSDGFKEFIVYGKVTFGRDSSTRQYSNIVNASSRIFAIESDNMDDKIGFSDLKEDNPIFCFHIGTVRATSFSNIRRVYVTQVHTGPYLRSKEVSPAYEDWDAATETVTLGNKTGGGAFSVKKFEMADDTGVRVELELADLPADAKDDDCMKIREVKVCHNGVASTAYILMSKPVAD